VRKKWLTRRRLDSNDLEGTGRVAVTAQVTASDRVDADVEKIVGRLSLEPTGERPASGARCDGPTAVEQSATYEREA
jgi:hypothetical protein